MLSENNAGTILSAFFSDKAHDWLSEFGLKKLTVVIRGRVSDFLSGASSLDALEKLHSAGFDVKINLELHAKLFWFGNQMLLGSSNLTSNGFNLLESGGNIELNSVIDSNDDNICVVQGIVDRSQTVDQATITRMRQFIDEKSEAIENRFNVDLDGIEYDAKFVFSRVGYNLEGNELGASFGLTQLKKLSDNIKVRQSNFKRQIEFFSKYPQFFINPKETELSETAWLAFPLQLKENIPFSRKEFMIFLEKRNIQTRVVFTGNINRQPGFININKVVVKDGYPNADYVMRNGVLLPLHHGLSEEMFVKLHSTIELFLNKYI